MLRRLVGSNPPEVPKHETGEFRRPEKTEFRKPEKTEFRRPEKTEPSLSNKAGHAEKSLERSGGQNGNRALDLLTGRQDAAGPADEPTVHYHFSDRHTELKSRIHQKLLEVMNLSVLDKMPEHQIKQEVGDLVRELLVEEKAPLTLQEQQKLVDDILDEVLGLGPLEPLLKDPTISDILVNCYDLVMVERYGRLEKTPVKFKDNRHLLRIIDKIVSAVGRRIDEGSPMVDARLLDGSRVNAVIPPVAVDGPLLSIRRFSKSPYTVEKLIEMGAITPQIAELVRGIVRARRNVLISGGTGSGKTTFLNAMSAFIDHSERIVTIEDAAELQLQQPQVARMETRPPNVEGKGEITQRELVKNALRMRPDRIIIGEVRAGEAFDMLQAMNTGHEGSMTTIHANTPRDALSRLEQMISMSKLDLPTKAMRGQIASAINVVIQLARLSDGKRRLLSLQEITGMEGDVITMQEIFRFDRRSTDAEGQIHGAYVATGIRPKFMEEFMRRGITVADDLFEPNREL
ncbi:MAG TPA: CpaF family protein [Woeseiaceae bacterium]|nr:CpaF family protein [Woeseiaceae bacterium]